MGLFDILSFLFVLSHSKFKYGISIAEATKIQKELAEQVITQDAFPTITRIGGMDVSNNPRDPNQMIYAAFVMLDAKNMALINQESIAMKQIFPYISGFLGFREAPPLLEIAKKVAPLPEIIMVDGHGVSHPRKLGIASHVGVLLDCATIGVAKSILVGEPAGQLGDHPGDQVPLLWKGQQIATVLRTKYRCNPLIISVGHKVSLSTATSLVMKYLKNYRLPEPTRLAHVAANMCRLKAATTLS